MARAWWVVLGLAACSDDAPPIDVSCKPALVYLNRGGGSYTAGQTDDATRNESVLLDMTRELEPWPHDDTNWTALVDCITTALAVFPRIEVTETDPGDAAHFELVFTTSYWSGPAGTTVLVPGSCRIGHQIELVFGDALPTYARACHVAMQGFAQMTAQLSLVEDCHDFVNNALDCSQTRAFLDRDQACVDGTNQPAPCRCGGTTANTYQALAAVFPTCP